MESVCSRCGKEANFTCECNNKKYCKKDFAKHSGSKGIHNAKPLDGIPAMKKTVSFAGSDSPRKNGKDDEANRVSLELDKKTLFKRVLEKELAKLQKFKFETLSCLSMQQQGLIRTVIVESKDLTNKVNEECKNKHEQLQSTISLLEVPGKIPFGNPIIERIKKCNSGQSILKISVNFTRTQLALETVLDFRVTWLNNPIIDQLRTYYQANQPQVPLKIQKIYEKIFTEKHYSTKKIDLSKSKLAPATLPFFQRVTKFFSDIRELKLGGNKLTNEACDLLTECLVNFPKLEKLDLSGNDLRGHGIEAISPALIEMKGLVVLKLARNNLGATGARHLALMLEGMKKIKELDLDMNALGTEGARYMLAVLPKLFMLKSLKLRDNAFGSESSKFLRSAFGKMQSIELLKLEKNKFTDEEKKTMQRVVRVECKIEF